MIKKVSYIAVAVLLLFSMSLMARYRQVDRFIKYNFSGDMGVIQSILTDVSNDILSDEKYDNYSIEELQDILRSGQQKIDYIEKGISKYRLLNKNFDVKVWSANDILESIETTLVADNEISESQKSALEDIIELNKKYSKISKTSTYIDNGNILTSMELPEEVNAYLDQLDEIADELR